MFLHVTDARYQEGYKIWIRFDDGTEGTVDLESELKGPVFSPDLTKVRAVSAVPAKKHATR